MGAFEYILTIIVSRTLIGASPMYIRNRVHSVPILRTGDRTHLIVHMTRPQPPTFKWTLGFAPIRMY